MERLNFSMNELPTNAPDPNEFARLVLFQLASLRAESIQTQSSVISILARVKGLSHEEYLDEVKRILEVRETERKRIFEGMCALIKLPPFPPCQIPGDNEGPQDEF
jgi:hypothetical protein